MISRPHKVICNELAQLGDSSARRSSHLDKSPSDKSTKLSALLPSRRECMNAIVVVFVYIQNYGVIDFANS